ncbi:rhodanese-related sulfurtransferase [Aureimonas sp. AU4]|uniref:oxygen-dependent tRNA uridine(34) hydroxylase TrhO n=1 Tax=Aureimonas sp. AU4 TaxID=1638163 RepID=UPI000782F892|nr:rhodanese-related sulfurtransferase [Aureimonas sp. AU4]
MSYAVAAFYRFVALSDPGSDRDDLDAFCRSAGVIGTILLAEEGINGTVAGGPEEVEALVSKLRERFGLRDGDIKRSVADSAPFKRLRVRVRPEIITLRAPEADPTKRTGRHVSAAEWNQLVDDPDVLVLDTRNRYETEIGTFEGAVVPPIDQFTDFKDFVDRELDPARHRRVAMFCTGGIRCEKASSYMLARGFSDVAQLDGGILRYLEDVPTQETRWKGDCFVFDGRTALGHDLARARWDSCFGCGGPIDEEARQSADYEPGVSCPRCRSRLSTERAERLRRRHREMT